MRLRNQKAPVTKHNLYNLPLRAKAWSSLLGRAASTRSHLMDSRFFGRLRAESCNRVNLLWAR